MGTKVIVNSVSPNRVSVNSQQRTAVRTVGIAAIQADRLANLKDVDASDPNTGETLVFDESLNKYVIKTLPAVDGGTF